MLKELKTVHDLLMEKRPEEASHPDDCSLCGDLPKTQPTEAEGGSVSYTEDQVKAKVDEAIASATADLQAKVKELEGVKSASEIEAKIAEVEAEAETKVSELQAQLDTAVLEAEKAKTEKEALLAYLEEEGKKAEEAATAAARRDERLAKVAEVASFPEEYVEANADRWASMDDEAFAAILEDWKTVGAKPATASKSALPAKTAMTASRETDTGSALKEVLGLRFKGVDPRTI